MAGSEPRLRRGLWWWAAQELLLTIAGIKCQCGQRMRGLYHMGRYGRGVDLKCVCGRSRPWWVQPDHRGKPVCVEPER